MTLKSKSGFLIISLILIFTAGCSNIPELSDGLYAQIETTKGTIVATLEYEKAPMTVINFVGLAEGKLNTSSKKGENFYKGLTFHRVIPDFMIQTGDPSGKGNGGPGYKLPDEYHPDLKHDAAGILSMFNSKPDTNGSQFFITHKATPWLDGKRSVFGHVVAGQDVVDAIVLGDTVTDLKIIRVGEKAKAFEATWEKLDAFLQAKKQADIAREEEARQMREKQMTLLEDGLYAIMKTSKGNIVLSLEFEKTPMTVANFVGLAEGKLNTSTRKGQKFYDGLIFHRVIADFMIQGGCPSGNGTGNPGYRFPDEFHPSLRHSGSGILSMANSGPGTNGSQFFITHKATPWLDDKHTVFGHVVSGQDVVDAIGQNDVIKSVNILRKGAPAERFIVTQSIFDQLIKDSQNRQKDLKNQEQSDIQGLVERKFAGALKTASGLRYLVQKAGRGTDHPKMGSSVTVHYNGTLLDGTSFDSSYKRGKPSTFKIGQVIQGWNEALQLMTVGAKWTLIIPPELGYGTRGAGSNIPPNSYLVFEVELISFE